MPVRGLPLIQPGDNIAEKIVQTMEEHEDGPLQGDILVVAHTIVSIAEGRIYDVNDVVITDKARSIAEKTQHPVAKVALALEEAIDIVREEPVLITRTKQGVVTDFSGVDASNAPSGHYMKLPINPGQSAFDLHQKLSDQFGFHIPVIIADTQGRPWRRGAVNIALGVAGMSAIVSNAGKADLYGRTLHSSEVCIADELAAAAELVMGQADEGVPVALIRGVLYQKIEGIAPIISRDPSDSLFK